MSLVCSRSDSGSDRRGKLELFSFRRRPIALSSPVDEEIAGFAGTCTFRAPAVLSLSSSREVGFIQG